LFDGQLSVGRRRNILGAPAGAVIGVELVASC